jgi:hypothetical protein
MSDFSSDFSRQKFDVPASTERTGAQFDRRSRALAAPECGQMAEGVSMILARSFASLDLEVARGGFAALAHNVELDLLPIIESAESGAFDSRDMNKNVLSATLGLDESVTFGRIEPFHFSGRH